MTETLIEAQGLTVDFGGRRWLPFGKPPARIQAVHDVSLTIARGEPVGTLLKAASSGACFIEGPAMDLIRAARPESRAHHHSRAR